MPPLAASCECTFGLWGSPGPRPRPDVSSCPTRSSSAGDAVERAWVGTMQRVAAMPTGTVDASVDGEWSFAQTLRHLVMATDTWLGKAVLRVVDPYHPIGQPYDNAGDSAAFDEGTGAGRAAAQPPRARPREERALVPAHGPRGGVGAPPLCRARPRGAHSLARDGATSGAVSGASGAHIRPHYGSLTWATAGSWRGHVKAQDLPSC